MLVVNFCRATEAEARPYVGDLEPLSALKAEYENGSQVFVAKIDSLADKYSGIRRARGDGNCFFRSFIFGYLERLVITNNLAERDRRVACATASCPLPIADVSTSIHQHHASAFSRMVESLKSVKSKMVEHGYQELVIDDPLEVRVRSNPLPSWPLPRHITRPQVQLLMRCGVVWYGPFSLQILMELLGSIGAAADPLSSEELVLKMREQGVSDYIVLLLRLVVSCQIQRDRDHFAPFIMVRTVLMRRIVERGRQGILIDCLPPGALTPPTVSSPPPHTPPHPPGGSTGNERRLPVSGDLLREASGAHGRRERPRPHRGNADGLPGIRHEHSLP